MVLSKVSYRGDMPSHQWQLEAGTLWSHLANETKRWTVRQIAVAFGVWTHKCTLTDPHITHTNSTAMPEKNKQKTICLLFSAMWFRLRHGHSKDLFKLVALERTLSVERDQFIQTVKQFVLNQVVFELATLGTRLDSTVTNNSLPPAHHHI